MSRLASSVCALLLSVGCNFQCDLHPGETPVVDLELQEPVEQRRGHLRDPAPSPPALSGESADPSPPRAAPPAPTELVLEPPAPAPEVPSGPLALTVGGEPLEWRTAWATSRGGRSLFVVFSTAEVRGCPVRVREPRGRHETRVHVSMYPVLRSEGAGWRVSRAAAFLAPSGLESANPREPAAGAIDEEPSEIGDVVRGGIDLRTPEIVARGRFVATYCGDELEGAHAPPLSDMHAEVGGEVIPIRGARVLLQDDMVRLRLSSAPTDCGRADRSDVEIEIRHYGRTLTPRQSEVYVAGNRVFVDRAVTFGGGLQDRIRFSYDRALVPGSQVSADVEFAGDVRGLPIVVRGSVTAPVCPPL